MSAHYISPDDHGVLDLVDFGDTLIAAGQRLKEPTVVTTIDETLVKSALLAVSNRGVKGLQRVLDVAVDGIVGPETQGALDSIDTMVLLNKLAGSANPSGISFEVLAPDYRDLYSHMIIDPSRIDVVDKTVARIKRNYKRYDAISLQTGVSPNFIGIVHSLESNLSFSAHFHNGDPLSARTINVPVGRLPPPLDPPYTWEESVLDALYLYELNKWTDWSPEGVAYNLEKYNGFGYRKYHPNTKSPYLWGFTNIYTKGKYDVDGHFDPNLVSTQCGGMALLKGLLS